MGGRRYRKRHRFSKKREVANVHFALVQKLLKRFAERATLAYAEYPDEVQLLLQELRDNLYVITPLRGDALWWPRAFDKRIFALNRAIQWVHRDKPDAAFAAVKVCYHRLKLLLPPKTAE